MGLLRKIGMVAGLWVAVAFLIASITFLTQLQGAIESALSPGRVLWFEIVCISPWALATPLVVWAARRFSFRKGRIYRSLAVHLALAWAVFSLHAVIQSLAVSYFYSEAFTMEYLMRDFWGFLDMRLLLYGGLLLGVYGIDFQRKNREIALREPRVRKELNKAKFHALLNRIQPDFMLNSIDLIRENLNGGVEVSEQILNDFSNLLRIMLNSVSREEVTVEEDLEAYRLYTAMVEHRLGHPVQKGIYVDDDCLDAQVPSFLMLIPLWEGIISEMEPGPSRLESVAYHAERWGQTVRLEAVMEGRRLPYHNFEERLRGDDIYEIVERLRSRYGPDCHFDTVSGETMIAIYLHIPFIAAGDDRDRAAPLYHTR